jgi:hypothetical protein
MFQLCDAGNEIVKKDPSGAFFGRNQATLRLQAASNAKT